MKCPNKECCIDAQVGKFCINCGIKLVELDKCDCGTSIYSDEKYCRNCGKNLICLKAPYPNCNGAIGCDSCEEQEELGDL